jgi:hypothetical protein
MLKLPNLTFPSDYSCDDAASVNDMEFELTLFKYEHER